MSFSPFSYILDEGKHSYDFEGARSRMDNLGIQIKAQAMLESKTSHTLRDLMESLQNDSGNIIIYVTGFAKTRHNVHELKSIL